MRKKQILTSDVLPVTMPMIEDYKVLEIAKEYGKEAARKAFAQWENDFKNALDQNDENFERALKLIKKCEFRYSLTHMFSPQHMLSEKRYHSPWCPYEHWHKDFRQ